MNKLPFKMIDADQHFYETDDCFTRHLPLKWIDEGRAVQVIRREGEATGRVMFGDQKVTYYGAAPTHSTGQPGAMLEYYKSGGHGSKGWFAQGMITADDLPESRRRDVRLKYLDNDNIEAAIMLPSLEIGAEWLLSSDPEALGANLTSYNMWLEEDWGFGADGRLFAAPCLALENPEWACRELDRVLERGAKLIHLRAGPVRGNLSPADPRFDPFWARINEAGATVCYHLANTGEAEYYGALWGESHTRPLHRWTPFMRATCFGDRAIGDTLMALVTHNLFGRFPNINVFVLEYGSEWVLPMVRKMDRAARMSGKEDWPFGNIGERPREVFKRHIKVSPFPEDDIAGLVQTLGATCVLGGSDWPHPEGVHMPSDLVDHLPELTDEDLRLIMRDNTGRALGLVAPAPAAVA